MFNKIITILLIGIAYLLVFFLGYLGCITLRHNLIGWFLIISSISYALGGPYLLLTNLRKEAVVRRENQGRSFWAIIPGFLVVFYASPWEYLYLEAVLPRVEWMQIIGLSLIILSLLLFIWARATLKGMYSGQLQVKVSHILVQHGPYRYIRHPSYAAYIIMSLGITIGYSSLVGLLSFPVLLVPAFTYRITKEEAILFAEFGKQFDFYHSKTSRLIPGIW